MRFWILLLLLLGLAGGVYHWYHADGDAAGKARKAAQPVPVAVASVVVRDVPQWLETVGRGTAYETVTLKARVDGQVAAVPFNEGQQVERGDILVRLDPADFEVRARQAAANLARDEALLAKARADLERYQALRLGGFVSEERLSEVRANLQAAAASVQAAQSALELARLQLAYTIIRAPIAGVIGAKLVFPGAGVKTNDTSLAVINRVRPLHISFAVPERHLPQVRAAMAKGRLMARIRVAGAPEADGVVTFLDNAVDTASGTLPLRATLANADGALSPGQFVQVRLALGTWPAAATLPAEAVQQGPEGSYVFVVRADQGIEQRKVTLVESRGGMAVVTAGLKEGETVVTDGHLRLTPKSKVQTKAAKQP